VFAFETDPLLLTTSMRCSHDLRTATAECRSVQDIVLTQAYPITSCHSVLRASYCKYCMVCRRRPTTRHHISNLLYTLLLTRASAATRGSFAAFLAEQNRKRVVAGKPHDAAAVLFDLKFADDIHYKFKSSQASKARLQSFKRTGVKQNLMQNGDPRSLKVTCFRVSGKAIRD